jgi:hypothetical protein
MRADMSVRWLTTQTRSQLLHLHTRPKNAVSFNCFRLASCVAVRPVFDVLRLFGQSSPGVNYRLTERRLVLVFGAPKPGEGYSPSVPDDKFGV